MRISSLGLLFDLRRSRVVLCSVLFRVRIIRVLQSLRGLFSKSIRVIKIRAHAISIFLRALIYLVRLDVLIDIFKSLLVLIKLRLNVC